MVLVLVTELEYRKAADVFRAAAGSLGIQCESAPASEAELSAAIERSGARHAIVGVERYTGPLYAALKPGAVLARFGVGHDGIDKARATAAGILATNTPGALDDSVAELTLGLIMSAARHVPTLVEQTRGGNWKAIVGVELRGRRLTVIGCGAIGCRVARIAAKGFGMHVVGCGRRAPNTSRMREEFGFESVTTDFETAVGDADFVSLHMPTIPETRHFISTERIALMPKRAWLINTARGMVVDEAALYEALISERLGGAALDVFENEPYVPVSPDRDLRRLPNVIMTPHIASSTQEACVRMAERALANITAAERGDYASMDLLNRDVLSVV